MGAERKYDDEFKKQAVKLTKEIGSSAAVAELGIPKSTLATWMRKEKPVRLIQVQALACPKNLLTSHSSSRLPTSV